VVVASSLDDLRSAVVKAKESPRTTVIHVETDPLVPAPSSPAWWDVPVAEVSALDSTREARTTYEQHKADQRHHLAPTDTPSTAQQSEDTSR
jgi:3D-(3,5/4)-trihydroxycyclohexane-1,2-dione acylhydrolase (decyclizing)